MIDTDIIYSIFVLTIYIAIIILKYENEKLSKNIEELSKDVARIKKQLKNN